MTFMSSAAEALTTRYDDAYRVARWLNGFGQLIKVVGLLVGVTPIAIVLMTVMQPAMMRESLPVPPVVVVGAVPFGALFALIFWTFGVVIAAQGQMLQATVDSAVNNSPLLTDEQRIHIMNLV